MRFISRFLILILILVAGRLEAETPANCPITSPQMRLVHECFTGDLATPAHSDTQFVSSLNMPSGRAYCYNSLIQLQQQPGYPLSVQVLKDNPHGELRIHTYTVYPRTLLRAHDGKPVWALNGLKAACYYPHPGREKCAKPSLWNLYHGDDLTMALKLSRGSNGRYSFALVTDNTLIESATKKSPIAKVSRDASSVNRGLILAAKSRLLQAARHKLQRLKAHRMSLRQLYAHSDQFRYCSMALDSFLRSQKLPDPFSKIERASIDQVQQALFHASSLKPLDAREPASLGDRAN